MISKGLGANWRLQFTDENGQPLSMESFVEVDFGAISFKEIFQNVKMLLTTPLFTVPLDRLLGVSGEIIDLPQNIAQGVIVEIIDALYQFEPRAEVVELNYGGDAMEAVDGHLIPVLSLKVNPVIFGTKTRYQTTRAFDPSDPFNPIF
jgi:hypothetical protein